VAAKRLWAAASGSHPCAYQKPVSFDTSQNVVMFHSWDCNHGPAESNGWVYGFSHLWNDCPAL